jgi:methyltransferase (TIGR00027 family)
MEKLVKENKPSGTALGVAAIILALSVDSEQPDLVTTEYVEKLSRLMTASGEMSGLAVRFYQTRIGAWLLRKIIDKRLPGQSAHFGRRKLYFEEQARQAISAGARQVLVLGAGYDLLCLRLAPEYPDVRWIEIDHPATASAKRRGLEAVGSSQNLRQIPVDLSQMSLLEVLKSEVSWNETDCSFVIAEGLTQYLTEDVVKQLFHTVDSQTGPSSRFGFTFVGWRDEENRPDAGPYTDKLLAEFEQRGEPWLWGIAAEALPEFMEKTPWKLIDRVTPAGVESFACVTKQ